MLTIQAAIFDMDGTLVDSLMLWDVLTEAYEKAYPDKIGTVISEEDNRLMRVLPLPESMAMLHEHYGLGESAEELLKLTQAVFLDFYSNRVQLKDGVREFLDALRNRGVKMCIASATPLPLVMASLDHCGIRDYFVDVLSCGEIGKGKDVPDIYLLAKERLGNLPDTWIFEDAFVAVSTAVGAGFPTVAIYDRYNLYQDKIQAMADYYVAPGETLLKLL